MASLGCSRVASFCVQQHDTTEKMGSRISCPVLCLSLAVIPAVFLQPASQIAEGSSPVWFCTVFSLLWVSLSALQPSVKRLEAFPSLLASFWYSNLHLPLFPSCAVFLHSEFPWYSFSKEQTSRLSLGRNGNLLV